MASDQVKASRIAAKRGQIRQTQERINNLRGQINDLEDDLAELQRLRTCCFDTKEQFIYSVGKFPISFDELEDIKAENKSAVSYTSKMQNVAHGNARTTCINNMDAGIGALNQRISNLIAKIEAKNASLSSCKHKVSDLKHEISYIQRSM